MPINYEAMATQARRSGDTAKLAFALRHIADATREAGKFVAAAAAAEEAIALYRTMMPGCSLDLANALRQAALAHMALGDGYARPLWHEARALYEDCDVAAGVDECDQYLGSES